MAPPSTVASFDGGRIWPVKRLVYDGPSAYSSLGVGRTGTPSQGTIYLIFEGGRTRCYEAVQVVAFNLSDQQLHVPIGKRRI